MKVSSIPRTLIDFAVWRVLLLVLLAPATVAIAQGGSLDPTFGGDGLVTTLFPLDSEARAVVLQPDGKFVVLGTALLENEVLLLRYNSDGSLDTAFGGGDGLVIGREFASRSGIRGALALQDDGGILVAGEDRDESRFRLARYLSDGGLDSNFGIGGIVTTEVGGSSERAYQIATQVDGKILVVGSVVIANSEFAVVRYNSNGSLDPTFGGGDGLVTTDFGAADIARDLAVLPDGRILVAGTSTPLSAPREIQFAFARYDHDGSLDTTFGGGDGLVTSDFVAGRDDDLNAVVLLPNGQFLGGGTAGSTISSKGDFLVARYDADGGLDTAFGGGDGFAVTDFAGGGFDSAFDMTAQADGKIVMAGHIDGNFGLARYDADGTLDTTFDTNGFLRTDFGAAQSSDTARAVVLDASGRIVAVGEGTLPEPGVGEVALARYNIDGGLDPTFGGGDGRVTAGGFSDETITRVLDILLQPDGKIVGAGSTNSGSVDVALARYNPDGTLDTAFSVDGRVVTRLDLDFSDNSLDIAIAIALQPDGKILALAEALGLRSAVVVLRYHPDGFLDSSFGESGIVEIPNTSLAFAGDLVVQPDGKIVVAGDSAAFGFGIVRLGSDGGVETAFGGGDGVGSIDFPDNFTGVGSVALQPDGKIVVSGSIDDETFAVDFVVVRFNADGSLDTTFGGGDGFAVTDLGTDGSVIGVDARLEGGRSLAIQPDGRILIGGSAVDINLVGDFALARYNPDGSPDTTFGGTGLVVSDFGTSEFGRDIAIQPDGRILLTGVVDADLGILRGDDDFAAVRYNADGTLDSTFGVGGLATADFDAGSDSSDDGFAVAIQPDGKIVVGGESHIRFGLARFEPGADEPCPQPYPDYVIDDRIDGKDLLDLVRTLAGKGMAFDLTGDGMVTEVDAFKFALSWHAPDCGSEP